MKTIAKAYLNKQECSAHEAVHHILPNRSKGGNITSCFLVNTNLPEGLVEVLLSENSR